MDNFTYEKFNNNNKLEKYEWDNVWWEHTEITDKKRILYIGDSISCGIRAVSNSMCAGEMLFDGFGSSKSLDNPFLLRSLKMFSQQQQYRSAVVFNNGLHGWHLSNEQYREYYIKTAEFLKNEYEKTPVALILTTDINGDTVRSERIKERNRIVEEVAKTFNFRVIDLFLVSVQNSNLHLEDGVHFNQEGYKVLAERLIRDIKNKLL